MKLKEKMIYGVKMSSENNRTFLVSKRETNYRGIRSEALTKVTLYTDIRRFYFRTEFFEKESKTKLGDLQYNLNRSFTEEIYDALEKHLIINENRLVYMIFRDWVNNLDLSESTSSELIRVCSV